MLTHSPRDLALFVISQRKKLKLSQAAVGALVGLKQATVSAFENKPESSKLDTIFRILSAVGLDVYIEDKAFQDIYSKIRGANKTRAIWQKQEKDLINIDKIKAMKWNEEW